MGLTAMILQYAMPDRVARETLTGDLRHFYKNGRFDARGVEVIGAGFAEVNGWYYRRGASQGPPNGFGWSVKTWVQVTKGRAWYEKDGGSYACMYWDSELGYWSLGHDYEMESDVALPPTDGWAVGYSKYFSRYRDFAPAPTLRVV